MSGRLGILNEWCRDNNVGTWGDSVVDSVIAEITRLRDIENRVMALLPNDARYLDPPDGGSVSPAEQLQRMVDDMVEQIHWLHTELTAHQSVLFQLGRMGEVSTAYGEDGRKVLDSVPRHLLELGRKAAGKDPRR